MSRRLELLGWTLWYSGDYREHCFVMCRDGHPASMCGHRHLLRSENKDYMPAPGMRGGPRCWRCDTLWNERIRKEET